MLKEQEEITRKYYGREGVRRRLEEKGENIEEWAEFLEGFDETSDFSVAQSLCNQALVLESQGDLTTALELHNRVGEIYHTHKYIEGEAQAIAYQAKIYQLLFDFDAAEQLYVKSESLFRH